MTATRTLVYDREIERGEVASHHQLLVDGLELAVMLETPDAAGMLDDETKIHVGFRTDEFVRREGNGHATSPVPAGLHAIEVHGKLVLPAMSLVPRFGVGIQIIPEDANWKLLILPCRKIRLSSPFGPGATLVTRLGLRERMAAIRDPI